jgi:hypothetical protein
MRKSYPSDISKEAFEQIRPVLESVRKRTKPRTEDFPKWRTVHSYFAKWSEPDQEGVSALERALKKIRLARPAPDKGAAPRRAS